MTVFLVSGSRSQPSSPMGFWVGACGVMFLTALAPIASATDLRGRVESQSNLSASPLPLIGSRVDLMDTTGQRAIASTYTGSDGLYYFRSIDPGHYVIMVHGGTYPIAVESRDYQDISPIRLVPVVVGIELSGGHRVALQGELEGEVWVYVSPRCATPCKPQLFVFKTVPEIANFFEYAEMDTIRPVARRAGKLLFDAPVGPEKVEATFHFGPHKYLLRGQAKGQMVNRDVNIQFDVYRQ